MEVGEEPLSNEKRLQRISFNDKIGSKYGFTRYKGVDERVGWLFNVQPTEILNEDRKILSAVDFYFVEENGSRFKISYPYNPYFYVAPKAGTEREVSTYLLKRFSTKIVNVLTIPKEDLDLPNHLIGLKRNYLKLIFNNVDDLLRVRREILPHVMKKKDDVHSPQFLSNRNEKTTMISDQLDNIVDIREHDVPYVIRVTIDLVINVGLWYTVKGDSPSGPSIKLNPDIVHRPEHGVLAFDIETTKSPLKFPDSAVDQIMMISYMIDGHGYLINNREIISQDVNDFEFTPRPEFSGPFTVYNEPNERALLRRFFDHIMLVKPFIFVTYNGDSFDWPFVEARAALFEMNMLHEIGFEKDSQGEYRCKPCVHMDCLKWVKRDSYLPIGSQGLKAVTRAKLRYNPVEIDPEDMCRFAVEQPQVMCNYSVSDAVATYYLYMKYVHPFIFALCTIIPMQPDDVLRKGSGTLCESLLMVEAFKANVIFPNKQTTPTTTFTEDGHVLEQETYVGASVEALESGVFRADIPCKFKLSPAAFQSLIEDVDRTLQMAIETEEKVALDSVTNLSEIRQMVIDKLMFLRDNPYRFENPIIYHLDVGAMYPNIILTNRLQPCSVVDDAICASCSFNQPGAKCQRAMSWIWRGEFMPATKTELQRLRAQLDNEKFPPLAPGKPKRAFHQLEKEEQEEIEKKRLNDYCKKVYKKIHSSREEKRETVVCQRENSFYVDTVRAFRDRRYEFKALHKEWKRKLAAAVESKDSEEIKKCNGMVVLYDSLQLAHKCILNSFYGYVMRRGARWYSMEMAGIVCYTGSTIITRARQLVEQIGRPLELDTDGIWCVLPSTFPENFVVRTSNEKKPKFSISYPCAMLNLLVKDYYTNDQYHQLVDPKTLQYSIRSENSIFFEVDGPYYAMILPAAKEEGKKIKKRYAVFNFDRTLAELKGFEVKRNGELELIKIFQSSVFESFLDGKTLEEAYESVSRVANYWLDVLYSQAANMPDSELFELIAENRKMSKTLEDYGAQKSTSIITAKRLAEFLGDQMVKDKGLTCRYVISRRPEGAPVTERAIPLAIFQADQSVKRHFLRKWLKISSNESLEIRNFLDWQYYIERLSGCIQKIITIPASLQGVSNPVPRVSHPDWLQKRLLEKFGTFKQRKLEDMFKVTKRKSDDSQNTTAIGGKIKHSRIVSIMQKSYSDKDEQAEAFSTPSRNYQEILGAPPTMGNSKEEFLTWLAYHKRKWELMRENKRQVIPNSSNVNKSAGFSNIKGFIDAASKRLLNLHLQIIELAETAVPGVFKVFGMIGDEFRTFDLHVDRLIYVNRKTVAPLSHQSYCRKVSKLLPRSAPVFHLYEYSVPESFFQSNYHEITTELCTPDVEGVYEMQTPLIFRCIATLGCVCKFSSKLKHLPTSLHLDDLVHESVADCSYLRDDSLPNTIYLYIHRSFSKMFFGVVFATKGLVRLYVLDNARENHLPSMSKLFKKERAKRISIGADSHALPPLDHVFEAKIDTDVKNIYKMLNAAILQYSDEKTGPFFIALQSSVSKSELRTLIPILNDVPVVSMNMTERDTLYNVLDWQKIAARHFIQHYLNANVNLLNLLEQSRYYNVPIANIPNDSFSYGCDIFYSRHLISNNHVLWCSMGSQPDLGGKEKDDYRLHSQEEESSRIEVNNPLFFTSSCIELEVSNLAVCALLNFQKINEYEGIDSAVSFDVRPQVSMEEMLEGKFSNYLACYDDGALCFLSLRILRSMVYCWIQDVAHHLNPVADMLLTHFHRWLLSSESLLYDPALKRAVNLSLQKVFSLLLREFNRLGAEIVYSDLNKLVINIKRHGSREVILNYVNSIVTNVCSREVFKAVHMQPVKFWKMLLWYDQANYGGILNLTDAEIQDSMEEESDVSLKNPLEMKWYMTTYLPPPMRDIIDRLLASYIVYVFEQFKLYNEDPTTTIPVASLQEVDTDNNSKNILDAIRVILRTELRNQLLMSLEKVRRKFQNHVYPAFLLREFNWRDPAFEFAKCLSAILFVDAPVRDEIFSLRRDAYRYLGLSEFIEPDESSVGLNLSLIIPQIWCKSCFSVFNVDLYRDSIEDLFLKSLPNPWACRRCKWPYNKNEFEEYLSNMLHSRVCRHITQDFQCSKCGEVKFSNFQQYCECSGSSYQMSMPSSDLSKSIKSIYWIAKLTNMRHLTEQIEALKEPLNDVFSRISFRNIQYEESQNAL